MVSHFMDFALVCNDMLERKGLLLMKRSVLSWLILEVFLIVYRKIYTNKVLELKKCDIKLRSKNNFGMRMFWGMTHLTNYWIHLSNVLVQPCTM